MTRRGRALHLANGPLLARHQLAAAIGTSADFATMVALVELGGISPPPATIASAILGGIVNFVVSRAWSFRSLHRGTVASQAGRYAIASIGGACLNAVLLAAALAIGGRATLPYPAARAIVAFVVGVLYTYPIHTRFVFQVPARPEER